MAVITPVPVVFNAATLKIGTHNFELSVSAFRLEPTYPETKFKGIGGNTISGLGTAEWQATLDYPQDWASANALSKFLFDNQGTTQVADITPKTGGPGFRLSLVLKAGPIGGTVDELLTGSVTLPVTGQPVTPIPA